jgi:hypothetical protein
MILDMRCRIPRYPAIPFLALVAFGGSGCSDSPVIAPEDTYVTFTGVSPAQAPVGTDLAPRVEVRDSKGRPLDRITVQFEVASGGGTLSIAEAVTTRDGEAAAGTWTLGNGLGEQALVARIRGVQRARLVVDAVAGGTHTLEPASDNPTVGVVGELAAPVPGVIARDRFGHLVADAEVHYTVPVFSGVVAGARPRTGADGMARPESWTLGTRSGTQHIVASAGSVTLSMAVAVAPGPAASMTAAAGTEYVGVINQPSELIPRVRVTDAFGNARPGVPVEFEVTHGAGTIAFPLAVTDSAGGASAGGWFLGPVVGRNEVVARVAGIHVAFTTWAAATDTSEIPGLYTMTRYAGHESTCPRGSADCRLTVEVRHAQTGVPTPGLVVEWTGTDGTTLTQTTDSRGRVTAYNLGDSSANGSFTQAARLRLTRESIEFGYTLVNPGTFNIDLRYLVPVAADVRVVVERAAARWEDVIIGDLPDFALDEPAGVCGSPSPITETVDDLLVLVLIDSIDGRGGVLGSAGPCLIRGFDRLPILGRVRLDSADVRAMHDAGTLFDVVLHEIGHVLGIGTLWTTHSVIVDRGGADPRFTGNQARSRFQLVGHSSVWPLPDVPVENQGGPGTRDGHWRQSVFQNELMTGWISAVHNPLSIMTIGSLDDLGYMVNYGAADPYTAGGAGVLAQALAGGQFQLREELVYPTRIVH